MKKIFLLLIVTLAVNSFAQDNKKQIDDNLFGTWSGSEKDQQQNGMTKNWIMHRFVDGTFVLLFTTVQKNIVENFAEKGRWWIDEKGVFNEFHNNSQKTDLYQYNVLDKDHISFKAIQIGVEMSSSTYEFIDSRVDDGA